MVQWSNPAIPSTHAKYSFWMKWTLRVGKANVFFILLVVLPLALWTRLPCVVLSWIPSTLLGFALSVRANRLWRQYERLVLAELRSMAHPNEITN